MFHWDIGMPERNYRKMKRGICLRMRYGWTRNIRLGGMWPSEVQTHVGWWWDVFGTENEWGWSVGQEQEQGSGRRLWTFSHHALRRLIIFRVRNIPLIGSCPFFFCYNLTQCSGMQISDQDLSHVWKADLELLLLRRSEMSGQLDVTCPYRR